MLVVISRSEPAAGFFVSHFLGVELLVVEKFDEFVLGQENVDQGYAQTNPRKWFVSVSDVVVEDDLASNSEHEGHIERLHLATKSAPLSVALMPFLVHEEGAWSRW